LLCSSKYKEDHQVKCLFQDRSASSP
jgi:hypothetical protein